MRERWYGDRRDLVKWSCLIHLANKNQLRRIVYVACLREDTTEQDELARDFGSEISRAVWDHFRHLEGSLTLAERFGVECHIVDRPFPASGDSRRSYWEAATGALGDGLRPSLMFLDPDTGLGSARSGTHVATDELRQVWRSLEAGECLVLYQHAWRIEDWRQQARQRFAAALDLAPSRVDTLQSAVAGDVVFLVAYKGEDLR